MKVSSQKCINQLSQKSMQATKSRNLIAIIAIMLTTLLFTAIFTIIISVVYSFEQSNFRQVGTYCHGAFKQLSYEQYEILRNDSDIKSYGLRRVAGYAVGDAFKKHTTEVSYCDDNTAKWSYLTPVIGRLPVAHTNEFATDTKVLSLLGAKGELGEEISLTIDVDGVKTTEVFTLCGIWDYDAAMSVSHILIAESAVERIITVNPSPILNKAIGTYTLNIMLDNNQKITEKMEAILENHSLQCQNFSTPDYVNIGVNWGYFSENENVNIDAQTSLALVVLLFTIIITGYLIIYNIFRISVANDIRHYGLLKTIGTTGRQIRRIVLTQALTLSALGIPLGLICGWMVGALLTPIVMNELNLYNIGVSINPIIFVFSAIFTLFTVVISCHKPAKIASRVTPIEALRFTETDLKSTFRKSKKNFSIFNMTLANLNRSRSKCILTITSLSLSIVIFSLTFTFTNSFNMEKYLDTMKSDFIVSAASYFNVYSLWEPDNAISKENIDNILNTDGITNSFITYGSSLSNTPAVFYTEAQLYNNLSHYQSINEETFQQIKENADKKGELYADYVQLLGMDSAGFSKIDVIEGSLDNLTKDGYIAVEKNNNFKLGDKVTVRFTDSVTFDKRLTHEKDYTICAIVDIPHSLGYRYSIAGDLFLLDSTHYRINVANSAPLYVAIDVSDEYEQSIADFIYSYTEKTVLDYVSKKSLAKEFDSFKQMFFILGTTLSIIVGIVGLLNFTNTILTGILARKREFATLRSIGMTGRQLKKMLIYEGFFYTAFATLVGLILNFLTIPAAGVLENIFWFCEYRFSTIPIAIVTPLFIIAGILLPLISYNIFNKKTIIERLRECE